jgi:hypothetical protein
VKEERSLTDASALEDAIVLGTRYPLTLIETEVRGRLLISLTDIPKGAIIELAPVQVLPAGLVPYIEAHKLDLFVAWNAGNPNGKTLAMPLGLFGLCNHSDDPSAELIIDYSNRLIRLVALRALSTGGEITVRYRDPSRSYPPSGT